MPTSYPRLDTICPQMPSELGLRVHYFRPNKGPVLAGPARSCQDGAMAPRDLERLAKAARKRRTELGLALNDKNAKAAGTSKGTWQRVERGESIRPTNYVKIDALLQWAPGGCMAVLDGREAVPAAPSALDPDVAISRLPPELIDKEARDVVKLAAVATVGRLSGDEIRDLSDAVIRDLRNRGFF